MEKYTCEIIESSKELTAKERVWIKNNTDAIKINKNIGAEIYPLWYAILKVHNERSDNQDYNIYVIVDKEHQKYTTSSNSFWNAFINIYNEMKDEVDEWGVTVYTLESKNFSGKQFLTCNII